jgi:hypothetical protein
MNCLSSEGLLQGNVKFLKAAYDVLGTPMFSVAPAERFVLCECEICKGRDNPEKGFKGSDLCIGINCVDRDRDKLDITARAQRSPNVWDGDNVEILLETQSHAYFQLAINPAGAMV